jgi:hypothetical protein
VNCWVTGQVIPCPETQPTNSMINKTVRSSFLSILLVFTACTSTTVSSLQPSENPLLATSDLGETIYFPRQKKTNGEWAAMDALTRGTLVLTDICIRLERDKSLANYLLIWPPDFNIHFENSAVEIVDGNGEIVASIGEYVQMSGGEIQSLSFLDKSIQEQVPSQCPAPYWQMGYEFTVVSPYPPPYP